ncbi:hypothetical protein GCM10028808_62760 [Spirosoma migulaei]
MKKIFSIIALLLIALSGYAQPAKYSFEEVAYSPRDQTKYVTFYSTDIDDVTGAPKYKVKAAIDIKNNKVVEWSTYLATAGVSGEICMSQITHISHLYLSTPNTGGVEAYACKNKFTNVVIYFLAGATTSDTLKFLIYAPSGPQDIKL